MEGLNSYQKVYEEEFQTNAPPYTGVYNVTNMDQIDSGTFAGHLGRYYNGQDIQCDFVEFTILLQSAGHFSPHNFRFVLFMDTQCNDGAPSQLESDYFYTDVAVPYMQPIRHDPSRRFILLRDETVYYNPVASYVLAGGWDSGIGIVAGTPEQVRSADLQTQSFAFFDSKVHKFGYYNPWIQRSSTNNFTVQNGLILWVLWHDTVGEDPPNVNISVLSNIIWRPIH